MTFKYIENDFAIAMMNGDGVSSAVEAVHACVHVVGLPLPSCWRSWESCGAVNCSGTTSCALYGSDQRVRHAGIEGVRGCTDHTQFYSFTSHLSREW